jgi:predicted ABC-type ATPase
VTQPRLVVLAGPNGAGKSTTAPAILRDALAVHEFVNADTIAQGLSAFDVDAAAIRAGRIMLDRIHELARQRVDFAFETTLASRSFAPWIRRLSKEGYRIELVFIWLASPDLAVARVASRVRSGGHSVPEPIIRRRFDRGLQNFLQLYRPLADAWHLIDSSGPRPIRLMAEGAGFSESEISSSRLAEAERILAAAGKATAEAIRRHRLLGEPIAVWRDGKVVILPPEQIPDLAD